MSGVRVAGAAILLACVALGSAHQASAVTLVVTATGFVATEGTPFGGTVATFTDSDAAQPASNFTAQIDWGDGTTTTGTVAGAAGSYTVSSSSIPHSYADEGSFAYAVSVHDTANNLDGSNGNTATVSEGDTLMPALNLTTATEGVPIPSGTKVATFTDTNTNNTAGDFTATINWGDATPMQSGVVAVTGGSITVSSSAAHTYPDEATFTISVTITDDAPGTATATAIGSVTVGEADVLFGTGATITATEGTPFTGTVATFIDSYTTNTPGDFTATIDWGDATTTFGTVSGGSGTLSVAGSHTYTQDGSLTTIVFLTDDAPGTVTAMATGTAHVAEAALSCVGTSLTPTEAVVFNGQVATVSDPGSADPASEFTATVDWGDGTTTVGTVGGAAGAYSVSGSHIYFDEGSFTVKTTVTETAVTDGTASCSATAAVAEGDVLTAPTLVISTATEGVPIPAGTLVASFTDSNTNNTSGDFTASIDWGDATPPELLVVSFTAGSITVSTVAEHTYADEGSFMASVTIADDPPGTATSTASGSVLVAEGDVLTPHGATITPTEGMSFTGTVATFTDSITSNTAGDFTAGIDWGDTTTTAGSVTGSGATFSVSGTHTYAEEGSFKLLVFLFDDAPGTASATAKSIANVADAPLTAFGKTLSFPRSGTTTGKTIHAFVASFTDADPAGMVADYSATIDWGDGSPIAPGAIASDGAGGFTVFGSHTYPNFQDRTITVVIRDVGGATATAFSKLRLVVSTPALGDLGLLFLSAALLCWGAVRLRRRSG